MRVTIERRVSRRIAEQFLGIYREAFEPLDRLSAVRQSLTDDEFRHECVNPDVLKFLGRDEAGNPTAMSMITTELELVPWINLKYYEYRFPDAYARKAITYFFTLLVAPDVQDGPWVRAMIEALSMHIGPQRGVFAFDCCQFNVEQVGLPMFVESITSRYLDFDVHEIDVQRYYAYEINGIRALDLRDAKEHGIDIDVSLPAAVPEPVHELPVPAFLPEQVGA